MNYRQRLQTVQAWHFTPENREIPDWAASHVRYWDTQDQSSISILQKEGQDYDWGWGHESEYVCDHWGYWIVKTAKGKFKIMDDEEFNRKYEASPHEEV